MILVYLLSTIFLTFLEFVLYSLGLGSLFFSLALLFFDKKVLSNRFVILLVVLAIIFDIGLHLPLGTYILAIFVGLLVLMLVNKISFFSSKIARLTVVFVIITIMNLVVSAMMWTFDFTGVFVASIFSTLFYLAGDFAFENFFQKNTNKIRV